MAATVKNSGQIGEYDGGSGSSVTFNIANCVVNDIIVLFQGVDWSWPLDALPAPTGTGITWTSRTATAPATSNRGFNVAYTGVVTSAGTRSVTVSSGARDATVNANWYHLNDEWVFHNAATTNASIGTPYDAPSIGSCQTGDYYFAAWQSEYQNTNNWGLPGSFSGAQHANGGDGAQSSGYEVLASGGASGTRTATRAGTDQPWCASSLVMRPVSTGQEETRTGSSSTDTATSVAHSIAQAEVRTVSAETGTATQVEHTTLQLEARSVTAETGTTTAVTETVAHTADADAPTGVGAASAETVQHFADADSVTGTATTTSFSRESVALPATGPLFFDFWIIDPDTGAYVKPLPDYSAADVSPVFGEPGSVQIDYPFDGANYDLLRDGVTHEQDLEIAIWVGGRKDREMRALLMESDADVVAEQGQHRFAGHFLEVLLAEMVVLPNPAHEKQETVFNAVTAGEIVEWLVNAAHAEGYLTGITIDTFSATHDSNGAAWADTIGNLVLSPGASYAEVLAELDSIGAAEWDITPARELRLFKWGTRGTDRTAQHPPIILRRGRHITEAARKTSVRDAGTDILMSGKEGLYTRLSDATAVARRGRKILRYESANNVADAAALSAVAQAQLQVTTAGALELTHGLSFGKDDPLPISDYDLGDWVGSDTGNPDVPFDRLRVKQWSFAEDENGEITGGVSLNYLFIDQTERLRRRLNRLVSGGAVVGTSEPPPSDDGLAPAAPTGVTVDSIAYKQGIDTYATLFVSWAAVTTNSDGSAATDVAGYRVQWRHDADPEGAWQLGADEPGTAASFGGVGSGVDVLVRVAAYDRDGNIGAWSTEVMHLTETDLTPPPVPSTPIASNYLGVLICDWDGLGSAGEAMPIDFSHVEVHMSTAAGFVPDATTYVDRLHAAGRMPVADLPYGVEHFFRLVAVDRTAPTPNKSAPSGTASATPTEAGSLDIGELNVGKLTSGTFTSEMTLSGIIRTAETGARTEMDGAGLRLYNDSDELRVELRTADGSALVTGEYRSAISGTRFVINAAGVNPDEMRFYPSSGSQYGKLTTITSQSEFFGAQSGLTIQGHSGRADGFSGVVNTFPDYASIAWGETSIQTVPHQIGMGAPRMHFAVFRDSNFDLNGDDEIVRIGVVDRDNPDAGFIEKTLMEYRLNFADEPSWRNLTLNSGVILGPTHVGAINGNSDGYVQQRASSFDTFTSSRDSKTDFADIDYEGGALGALGRARPQKFRRKDEVERDGPAARVHIGPMADDLPTEVVVHDETLGLTGLSMPSLLGLVHAGVTELADAVAALTARVDTLERGGPRTPGGPA